MTEEAKAFIFNCFKDQPTTTYKKGTVIVDAEHPHDQIHFIVDGYTRVYGTNYLGEVYTHIIYGKNELFPMATILADIRRGVYYEAFTTLTTKHMSRATFLERIEDEGAMAKAVMLQLCHQFYIYADRLDNLQYRSAHDRVVYRILFLASRFGEKLDNGITRIGVPLTHEALASAINLVRESVSREIEQLEKRGLIYQENHQIHIIDMNKLQEELQATIHFDLP